MPQRNGREGPDNGGTAALLQAERNGEEPAHAGVNTMIGAEQRQADPGPNDRLHGFLRVNWGGQTIWPATGRIGYARPPAARLIGIAERVRRRITALEPNLVRAVITKLYEEVGIGAQTAIGGRIQFGHPPLDAGGVELLIPRDIQRVGDIHPPAVAADLDHLRPTIQG